MGLGFRAGLGFIGFTGFGVYWVWGFEVWVSIGFWGTPAQIPTFDAEL